MNYTEQDNRICLFYIVERLTDIIDDSKSNKETIKTLKEFKNECVYNLGINSIHNHYTGDNKKWKQYIKILIKCIKTKWKQYTWKMNWAYVVG